MALESKPLFHPGVIRQQVRAFSLPERVADWQPKLQHWAGLIATGRANDFKETARLPDFLILQHNLYGVDLNAEAAQICQLSLWIKTAARGKRLTGLDHTITTQTICPSLSPSRGIRFQQGKA
jgi:hypothetical protein